MPGTMSSTLHIFNSNNLKFVSTIISNLQMKKQRHREVKEIKEIALALVLSPT